MWSVADWADWEEFLLVGSEVVLVLLALQAARFEVGLVWRKRRRQRLGRPSVHVSSVLADPLVGREYRQECCQPPVFSELVMYCPNRLERHYFPEESLAWV